MSLKSLPMRNKILKILIDNQYVTLNDLAKELNMSYKAVRGQVNKIDEFLVSQQLGTIKSKPGFGIWLETSTEQLIIINQVILFDVKKENENFKEDRLYRLLAIIIARPNNIITRQLLSEMLHISMPMIAQTINEAKDWLKVFNVDLVNTPDEGLYIEGNESSQRLAIKHVIKGISEVTNLDDALKTVLPRIDIDIVKHSIKRSEAERNLNFVDEAFDDCLIYSSIVIQRYLRGELVEIDDEEMENLKTYTEYDFASSILKRSFSSYGIEVPEEEIAFLSIHILCSRMIDTSYISDTKEILYEFNIKLDLFIEKLMTVLGSILNIDLMADFELRRGLKLHLKSCVFRLKYDRMPSARVTRIIKDEYPQTFRISWVVSVLFEEYFNIKINEVELSYIVIYIQSAIERNQRKLTVCLVSSSGVGLNTLICDRLKRKFTRIDSIETISLHSFNKTMSKDFDLVISTHNLDIDDYVRIDELLSDASLIKNEKWMNNINLNDDNEKFDVLCHSLFDPDLILLDLECSTREEVIKEICDQLYYKNIVSDEFYLSVLEHENSNSTSIGNLSATPHGDQDYIFESRVAIATLKDSIDWDGEKVKLVFLLAIKTNNTLEVKKTQLFCKQYLNIVETVQQVEYLLEIKNNFNFYKFLIR